MNIFTDGACSRNGQTNAKAGIGIFLSENHLRNVSERISGKQTNNTAELSAVIQVFTHFREEIDRSDDIIIHTDSEYVLKCCGDFGRKAKQKEWKTKSGYIPNHELVKQIYELYHQYDNVNLQHIRAHTGKQDEFSKGNEGADRLATLAIGKTPSQNKKTPSQNKKTYLNVSYERKEEAKQYGAKWDPQKKKWYCQNPEKSIS